MHYLKNENSAVIPARLNATRLPRKLLADLCGKPVLQRTYEAAIATGLFPEVIIATDSDEIREIMETAGATVVMSRKVHESGSDRIAEAVSDKDIDVIINIQGDEPFVNSELLKNLIKVFQNKNENVQVASVMREITEASLIADPNVVKVVTDLNSNALYFSRHSVPFKRDPINETPVYQHIGVYAFRKEALMSFTSWPQSPLEIAEKLEQLRYLEHGVPIKMVMTDVVGISIDVPEDLERAREYWEKKY
ncbi:MAG: 3-deoxy-manno-octulosonate cytidylyltransferase [Saprospiraceae bacterium]|nr:3-deoxy-manno-octulosonate cytidylyltransferase [Saprospiraceae bacterium]